MPLLMCPNCDASMQAVQRASVEFDMCPRCRGVWLDRGELDKIIERAAPEAAPAAPAPVAPAPAPRHPAPQHAQHPRDGDYYREKDGYYKDGYYRKKKRSGFLGELFDFD